MHKPVRKVVFVDRDGVINVDLWKYVETWKEFRFEKGALEALKILTDKGFDIFIISNQAGVGDGIFSEAAMWQVHEKMVATMAKRGIKIRGTRYCIHAKKEKCDCRKPKTRLLEKAVMNFTFDKEKTYFVGDKISAYYIFAIIIASIILGFWNEFFAERSIEKLLKRVALSAIVIRKGMKMDISGFWLWLTMQIQLSLLRGLPF